MARRGRLAARLRGPAIYGPKAGKLRDAFNPWRAPTSPPPGTYDPALDAAQRAAQRGYGDLQMDTDRELERGGSDLALVKGDIERSQGRTLADMLRERARASEDFGQSRTRLGEDYSRATGQLGERYKRLGNQQSQQQRVMGGGRGVLAQAMMKRAANRANEQVDLDRTRDRGLQEIGRAESRFMEDTDLDERRLNEDASLGIGRAGMQWGRRGEDLALGLQRAGRELDFFGQDTSEQRFFQAAQTGQYVMPDRGEPGGIPRNEFSDAQGPYRVIKRGKQRIRVRPSGARIR